MTEMSQKQSLSTVFLVLTSVLFTLSQVQSKSIYTKLLVDDEETYPLVVKIRENYSKVNSRSPTNMVSEAKLHFLDSSSSQSAEDEGNFVTDYPQKVSGENLSVVMENDGNKGKDLSLQDHNSDMETSSIIAISTELPEDLMRYKIESIMRRHENVASLLEKIAVNHLNARYGGYVVQNIPSYKTGEPIV